MKKKPNSIKPGHVDGQRGDWLRRFPLNGCVWHQHMKDIKDENGSIIRSRVAGLELVSSMEHWWLDREIKRPDLQQEDWDFRTPRDGKDGPLVPLDYKLQKQDRRPHAWQLPWAWQYECWREWQPWSDFERWRGDWRKEVKRLRDPSQDWIRGPITKEEAEQIGAGGASRLPLWILRDFAAYFPHTPWVKIPHEKRKELEGLPQLGSQPPSLDGSLLALKEPDPSNSGLPPIPEKLRVEHNGLYSLRQPDPNNEEEKALYAEYRQKWSEALQRHREYLESPGRYRDEVVKEITPRQFVGTYIIYIPWYHTDDDLKAGFAAWLKKKEGELGPAGCRKKFSRTGWDKRYADLKQLGALRLLREMTAEEAASHTERAAGRALYNNKPDWYDARKKAELNLARHFGVA